MAAEGAVHPEDRNVLVIGGGAREHAIAWKLSRSPQVKQVYVAPGNAGTDTAEIVKNIGLNVANHNDVVNWCKANDISLVVVGPENPLADGIADDLKNAGVPCFGPSRAAAQMEASKQYAKQFMDRHAIPTARWQSFTDVDAALQCINTATWDPFVVKASGLAAGKGVVVASDREDAAAAARAALGDQRRFGDAGSTVVVEELLWGYEISCLALTDGKTLACFPPAQDYKRLLDRDAGPNTGGMGAFCPVPFVKEEQIDFIKKEILQKTIDGMRKDGVPYVGVLYAGLMVSKSGKIRVLEYNCRFGDPETQVLMSHLSDDCDLYEAMMACVTGTLKEDMLKMRPNSCSVCVVCASEGYPGPYEKGKVITGIDKVMSAEQLGDGGDESLLRREGESVQVFHAGTARRAGQDKALVTSGGRVLSVVATARYFVSAKWRSHEAAESIQYDGKIFRKDIANRAMSHFESLQGESTAEQRARMWDMMIRRERDDVDHQSELSYSACGVNISAGEALVEAIKPLARSTQVAGCMQGLGGFGGLFDLAARGFQDPILVSGTDGVGTKLLVAQSMERHDTVGIDLVAMCVNDVLCHGAQPLFFLDYFATGALSVEQTRAVIVGIADGCKQAQCALIGGETAELPGMYKPEAYDIAGFVVGAVERTAQLPRRDVMTADDVIIGLASSGVHSNGLSMVRRVLFINDLEFDSKCPWDDTKSIGESILTPTQIYVQSVLPLMRAGKVKGAAHVTGGGLPGNVPRMLPDHLAATLDARAWTMPPVFKWLAKKGGGVSAAEMARTFNCGLGMTLVVAPHDAATVCQQLQQAGVQAAVVGRLRQHQPDTTERVHIEHLHEALEATKRPRSAGGDAGGGVPGSAASQTGGGAVAKRTRINEMQTESTSRRKVGVLISGTGTNLQALIDYTQNPYKHSDAEIVLVLSNKADAQGLERARAAGIPCKVISHKDFSSREAFDDELQKELEGAGVEIVCLAGFMRILSGKFVRSWRGRLINIHPSLLPAFKGLSPHKQALDAGVTVSGCTVHFVEEEVDAGAILVQETVPVLPTDTEDDLVARVKDKEHKAYPRALELLASGLAHLNAEGKVTWKQLELETLEVEKRNKESPGVLSWVENGRS